MFGSRVGFFEQKKQLSPMTNVIHTPKRFWLTDYVFSVLKPKRAVFQKKKGTIFIVA